MRTSVSRPDKSVTCCILNKRSFSCRTSLIRRQQRILIAHKKINAYFFLTRIITWIHTYYECVIKWCKNVGNTKNILSISNFGSKSYGLFLWLPNLPLWLLLYHKKNISSKQLNVKLFAMQKKKCKNCSITPFYQFMHVS